MNAVEFLDLRAAARELQQDLQTAQQRVLDSGQFIRGEELANFERRFARYTGAGHCVGVANGLDALVLSLRALGIGHGDEVIVPSNTFIATWLAVTAAGAVPVPVEPDDRTYNIDPGRIEAAITRKTRCIMPVHLYGQPADLDAVRALADRYGLSVVEDAAQAHGARYKGRPIGSASDAVTWSFYPGKNLGALGDGGAVTCDDPELAARLRLLGNYGSQRKYVHEVPGTNSRLDELQAAFLTAKLAVLDEWNARRARIASRYLDALCTTSLTLPYVPPWAEPSWHLFVVRHPRRDELASRLAERGVTTLIHYPRPPHLQDAYAALGFAGGSFPVAERQAGEVLSLPIGPHLRDESVETVIEAVRIVDRELAVQ